jgi:formylglycine-generating enzyme required for sulfatase activity
VTQAVWSAVMGANPSRFQSPDRPVEQVSWYAAQQFIEKANSDLSGPALRLPYECEWEHACRAGTDTAVFAGPIEYRGVNHAPVLEAIGWYGGNSNHEFDLTEGEDCSDWEERSHSKGSKAGTRRVGLKRPNPWGLYDILGNVWEWCEDGLQEYPAERVTDPVGRAEGDASRVCRGGAWPSFAFNVRAGYRFAAHPSDGWSVIGFRLARGPFGHARQDRAAPDHGKRAVNEPRGERRGTRRPSRGGDKE